MGKTFGMTALTVILALTFNAYVHAELVLLNVVFRHGDRAPDNNGLEMYPNDSYINNTFDPMRLGGLTNNGKLREYYLGMHLRREYNSFLGETYYPSEVSARSTNVDRTKMSLQLVLAALYQPRNSQVWNSVLNWQPIPANYIPSLDDNLMVPEECPKYLYARERVENSEEFKSELETFRSLLDVLTVKTGKNISNSNDMYFLYHALMAEWQMNLKQPEWVWNIFPKGKLLDGINLEYKIFSYNTEMRRLNGGMLLRKFLENIQAHIDGSEKDRKIYLYSGHETNVAAVLQALGIYMPHVPDYSSGVIVELHRDRGEYYVRVKYYKGVYKLNEEPAVEKIIPGCGASCTLANFKQALKDVIPSDDDIKCDKRSLRGALERNEIKVASGIGFQIINALKKEDRIKGTLQ